MRILVLAIVSIIVGACSPDLHTARISEFSKSAGTLQTTLTTLRDKAFEGTVELESIALLINLNQRLETKNGCSEDHPENCGLWNTEDNSKFPPDRVGERAVEIANAMVDYAKTLVKMAGADEAKVIDKAVDKTRDALKGLVKVIKDVDGAADLGVGLDALKASPDVFSTLAKTYVDQKRLEALRASVAKARPVVALASSVLKSELAIFNRKIISRLESQLEDGITLLDRDACEEPANRNQDRCMATATERLAIMKRLADTSLRVRATASIGTVKIAARMADAHAALEKAYGIGEAE